MTGTVGMVQPSSVRRVLLGVLMAVGCSGEGEEFDERLRGTDQNADSGIEDLGVDSGIGDADAGASETDVSLPEIDWPELLPRTYQSSERTQSLGTLVGRLTVAYNEGEGRFDVLEAGNAVPKFYFSQVEVSPEEPRVGYVRFPEQTYAPGRTGPAMLVARGSEEWVVPGQGRFDGRVTLDAIERPRIVIGATITVNGNAEGFTVELEP